MKREKVVIVGQRMGVATSYHFDDYPPGTPLPEPPSPDLSVVPRLLRPWARRRLNKLRPQRLASLERARDDYYRQKGSNASGSGE